MQTQEHSLSFKRNRRFYLMLPVLVFPFLTMSFWALGGGRGKSAGSAVVQTGKGFNLNLPGAHLKEDKGLNKLSFYKEADSDSAKLAEQLKRDPYFKRNVDTTVIGNVLKNPAEHTNTMPGIPQNRDPNEERIYRKIDELNRVISAPGNTVSTGSSRQLPDYTGRGLPASGDIDRLERMLGTINHGNGDPDPQIKQLTGMLDKIMAVQHPEMIKDSAKAQSEKNKGEVFPVTNADKSDNMTFWESVIRFAQDTLGKRASGLQVRENAFYGADGEGGAPTDAHNAVRAVIPEIQTLVSGATVKMELADDIYINGTNVPKGSFVYGTATVNNERLMINVVSIRSQNSIFPVALTVYDRDGMQGIYIPGAITRDVTKQSADDAINGVGITTLDPSLAAQAAGAGIQAAKSLLSKKVKLVRVTVKAGYEVLLRDNKQK